MSVLQQPRVFSKPSPAPPQDCPSLRDRQARRLAARFALSPPVACLVAERAFGLIEEMT